MSTIRKFKPRDTFNFGNVNLDHFTETFHFPFYFEYLSNWPYLCFLSKDSNGRMEGYHFGKIEGREEKYHGHLTAITIAREYRRLGISRSLMYWLKQISEEYKCYYVDLFMRKSNSGALKFYENLGYSIYREILNYYSSDGESGLDLRLALSRDIYKKSIIPLPHPVRAEDCDDL